MSSKYNVVSPFVKKDRQWPDKFITENPEWCSVDLRDGNQALPNPLTLDQKKEFYQLLLDIGFKSIEVGFPSASQEDFDFCRYIVDENKIPDDVMISVLAPSRPPLIKRTMEALAGYKKALVHFYVATSDLHREHVIGKTREETIQMVIDSIDCIKEEAKKYPDTRFYLEFSPEEFTDTDMDFAIEICDIVVERWAPQADEKVILNLPATVERRRPTDYADMIEYFIENIKAPRESVSVSLHAHNDMGCAVASSEMALQAGADRVEGTLFGHGERSGNVDLITLILNLDYLGVDTQMDFSNLGEISETVTRLTGMKPHERHPYAGDLVFSAFSGSHQDAIHKCLEKSDKMKEVFGGWKIPYLHIDPSDIGRSFEKFIRINSQSGKGGIAHIIQLEHKIKLPRHAQVELAQHVQAYAEKVAREISSDELTNVFKENFMNPQGGLQLVNYWPTPDETDPTIINGRAEVFFRGEKKELSAVDNGPISAFVAALKQGLDLPEFKLTNYEEDSCGDSATADAVSFVDLECDGQTYTGIGRDSNINQSAVKAVTAAINKILIAKS